MCIRDSGKAVLPLGTLTVEETKAPNGYLLEGAYMQAGDKSEQIKGLYLTQITEEMCIRDRLRDAYNLQPITAPEQDLDAILGRC